MSSIEVKMKDGIVRYFPHADPSGGSNTYLLHFEGIVAVITDKDFKKTVIPIIDIEEITETPSLSFLQKQESRT